MDGDIRMYRMHAHHTDLTHTDTDRQDKCALNTGHTHARTHTHTHKTSIHTVQIIITSVVEIGEWVLHREECE